MNPEFLTAEWPHFRISPLSEKNGKTVGAAGRSGGRNERIVVSAKRDGKLHGPDVNQTVAARALGWRSEVSAVNRTHGPARSPFLWELPGHFANDFSASKIASNASSDEFSCTRWRVVIE